jgi:hypothetical protein
MCYILSLRLKEKDNNQNQYFIGVKVVTEQLNTLVLHIYIKHVYALLNLLVVTGV